MQYVEALKKVQKDLGALVFEPLVRTYAAAGKKFPGMWQRLKIENVEVGEETAQLLDSILSAAINRWLLVLPLMFLSQ